MLEAARIEREKVVNQLNDLARKGTQNAQALKSVLKEIAEIDFSDIEIKTQGVFDKYNEMLSLGIDKGKAKHFLNSKLEAIANENIKAVEKSEAEAIEKQLDLRAEYYKTIGEYERVWQIEKVKIIEKYEKLTFENGEKITKEQLNKLLKMEEKAFLQGSKIAKNSFKDIKGSWADTVSTMSKTVEEGFFDFFMQKTKSLKGALKDIGQGVFKDFISPYARSLSQGLSGGFGALLGGGSNLASIASFYGLTKNSEGGFSGQVNGTDVVISGTGEILSGNSAFGGAGNILIAVSNLKSIYSMFSGGYSGLVSNFTTAPAGYLSSYLSTYKDKTSGYFKQVPSKAKVLREPF